MAPVLKAKRLQPSGTLKGSIVRKVKDNAQKPKQKRISGQPGIQKIKKSKKRSFDPIKANRGVVFIKHIPHGFYEEQMQKYFEQFGVVTRVRVARSERTARSRGFGYVEFKVPEVAKIAAETMDNYIMFKHVLKTSYLPPEMQIMDYFRKDVKLYGSNDGEKLFKSIKNERVQKEIERINRAPTDEEHAKRVKRAKRLLKRQQARYGVDLSACLVNGSSSSNETEEAMETKSKKKKINQTEKIGKKKKDNNKENLCESVASTQNSETDESMKTKKDKKKKKKEELKTIDNKTGVKKTGKKKIAEEIASKEVVEKTKSQQLEKANRKEMSPDGKILFKKFLNETFEEESDSSDENFKIDHSFSASDDDSSESENLENFIESKLKSIRNKYKESSASESEPEKVKMNRKKLNKTPASMSLKEPTHKDGKQKRKANSEVMDDSVAPFAEIKGEVIADTKRKKKQKLGSSAPTVVAKIKGEKQQSLTALEPNKEMNMKKIKKIKKNSGQISTNSQDEVNKVNEKNYLKNKLKKKKNLHIPEISSSESWISESDADFKKKDGKPAVNILNEDQLKLKSQKKTLKSIIRKKTVKAQNKPAKSNFDLTKVKATPPDLVQKIPAKNLKKNNQFKKNKKAK